MATRDEYLVFAAAAYNDARQDKNIIDTPNGWTPIPGPSDTHSGVLALLSSGLSATAFRNDASGEIVISFKGTDFLPDNLFQTISDLLADLTLGAGLAAPSLGALKSNNPLQGPGARIIGTPKFIRGISPC